VPIAFGAVLHHLGNLGPAEIPAKRRFIYRQLLWTAQAEGTPLRFPPGHPFNPLSALRLCLAAGGSAQAVDVLFDWIWRDGNAADSAEALREPAARLGIEDVASAIATPRSRSSCGATPRPPLLPACSACRPWPSMANCSGATTPTH
jgi:2-hydroxychromene-2-carboxylate isomerase